MTHTRTPLLVVALLLAAGCAEIEPNGTMAEAGRNRIMFARGVVWTGQTLLPGSVQQYAGAIDHEDDTDIWRIRNVTDPVSLVLQANVIGLPPDDCVRFSAFRCTPGAPSIGTCPTASRIYYFQEQRVCAPIPFTFPQFIQLAKDELVWVVALRTGRKRPTPYMFWLWAP